MQFREMSLFFFLFLKGGKVCFYGKEYLAIRSRRAKASVCRAFEIETGLEEVEKLYWKSGRIVIKANQ